MARTPSTGAVAPAQRRFAAASLRWSNAALFAAQLSGLWWLGTVAGGVIAGFAPAAFAACTVARARLRGGDEPLVRSYAAAYRAGFGAANAALLPPALVGALVASSLVFGVQNGLVALAVVAGVVAVPLAAALGVIAPMLAHYEIRPGACALTASRFALRNPALCVQLLLAASVIGVIAALMPAAGVIFAPGAWLAVSTFLCLNHFAANDRALEARSGS
jgi:uncharacterized membrane protein YesL